MAEAVTGRGMLIGVMSDGDADNWAGAELGV